MNAAIQAMHAAPSRRWTLKSLAEHVGMSRTAFTLKFKDTVGVSVMHYLTRWRMLLTSERLLYSEDPIATITLSLGYESESSFSTAFKRVVGVSPRQYGQGSYTIKRSLEGNGMSTMSTGPIGIGASCIGEPSTAAFRPRVPRSMIAWKFGQGISNRITFWLVFQNPQRSPAVTVRVFKFHLQLLFLESRRASEAARQRGTTIGKHSASTKTA